MLAPIPPSQASVLDNLFELYAHDFSEWLPLQLKSSGRFELGPKPDSWADPDRHRFFIQVDGRLSGFALARRGSRVSDRRDVMDVDDFFVVRGERRRGTGLRAALALLRSFDSAWEIRVRRQNPGALSFWANVAQQYSGQTVTPQPHGAEWLIFRI
jgi:predicted acetyltransferase